MINLDGRPVTDSDLEHLGGLTGLRKLYLNGTRIGDAGLSHLKGLTGLQILEMRETGVGDAGMEHLVGMSRLEELFLYETKVGDAGMESLARLPALRELSLARTSVGDAGLAHLARATQLRELKLGRTRVTDAGLMHLRGLKNLEFLDLQNTGITDAGLEHLAGMIELRLLFLDGTGVTDVGAGSSAKCFPCADRPLRCEGLATGRDPSTNRPRHVLTSDWSSQLDEIPHSLTGALPGCSARPMLGGDLAISYFPARGEVNPSGSPSTMISAYCCGTLLSGLCLAASPLTKDETPALPVVVLIGDSIRMGYPPSSPRS